MFLKTRSLPLTLTYFTNFSDCHVVALMLLRVVLSLKREILTLIRLKFQLCSLNLRKITMVDVRSDILQKYTCF